MKHFIITNRLIEIINEQERIKEDGTEEARDAIRFAEYDTETKNYNIFRPVQLNVRGSDAKKWHRSNPVETRY